MQNNKITVFSLFTLLFISRLMTRLIYIPSGNGLGGGWDEILTLLLGFAVNVILFLPVMALSNKNGAGIIQTANAAAVKKIFAVIYAAIFLFVAVQSVGAFDYFATSSMSSHSRQTFFSILLAAAACYAAVLGLKGLSRAACIIGFLMVVSLVALAVALFDKYDPLSMSPPLTTEAPDFANGLISSSPLMPEVAVLAALYGAAKGNIKKGFFIFLIVTAVVVCAVVFIPAAVFGQAVNSRLFALYQSATVADFGSFSRLDPIIVSLWIGGVFVKASLFLTSAVTSLQAAFPNMNKIAASISAAVLVAAASTALSGDISLISSPALSYAEQALTVIGAFILPLIALAFKKPTTAGG